jgi:hypothetical protein
VRALRSRPPGSDPLTILDYLYLAALPPLLFANDVWQDAKTRLGGRGELKQAINDAVSHITPVRNEIAHVREVERDRLLRADLACNDLKAILKRGS